MPLIFTAVGIVFLLYQFFICKKMFDVKKKWRSASGIITKSETEKKEVYNVQNSYGNKKGDVFKANVEYVYHVEGREFKSEQIGLQKSRWQLEYHDAKEILDRYPLAEEATVFYNPKKPYESVLEVDMTFSGIYMGLTIALILIVFGIGAFFMV